jgi:hypothetical protein
MPGSTLTLPSYVGGCRTLDANKDGKVDLACLQWVDTDDMAIVRFLGNGDGTFKPFVSLPHGSIDFSTSNLSSAPILHGDFNGDGKQDIIAIGSPSVYVYNSYILFGNGNGTFASPSLVPDSATLWPSLTTMAVTDINKDGRDDVINTDARHIYAALSNGDGTFATVSTTIPSNPSGMNPSLPAFADFNHDGKLDAVNGQGSTVYVLKGHGTGHSIRQASSCPSSAMKAKVGPLPTILS